MVPALSSMSFMSSLPFSRPFVRKAYRLYVSPRRRRRTHRSGRRRPPRALRRGRRRATARAPAWLAAALVELARADRAARGALPRDLPGHTRDGVDRRATRRLPPPHADARPARPARRAGPRSRAARRPRLGLPDRLLGVLHGAAAVRALRAEGRHHALDRDRRAAAALPAPVAHRPARIAGRAAAGARRGAQPAARLAQAWRLQRRGDRGLHGAASPSLGGGGHARARPPAR